MGTKEESSRCFLEHCKNITKSIVVRELWRDIPAVADICLAVQINIRAGLWEASRRPQPAAPTGGPNRRPAI